MGEHGSDDAATTELDEPTFRKLVAFCTGSNVPEDAELDALRAEAAKLIGTLVEGVPLDRGDAFAMACHRRGGYV